MKKKLLAYVLVMMLALSSVITAFGDISGDLTVTTFFNEKTSMVELKSGDSYTFTFHDVNNGTANYNNFVMAITSATGSAYTGAAQEVMIVRADSWGWGGQASSITAPNATTGNPLVFTNDITDWAKFLSDTQAGVDCTVNVSRDGNQIAYVAKIGSYTVSTTGTSTIALPDSCYIFFTGEACTLTGFNTVKNSTTETSASEVTSETATSASTETSATTTETSAVTTETTVASTETTVASTETTVASTETSATEATTVEAETPVTVSGPDVASDLAAYYTFDDTLENFLGTDSATTVGSTISAAAASATPTYVAGVYGNAVSFAGAGSDGIKLSTVPSGNEYTISYDVNLTAATQYSPMVFLETSVGDDARWISVAAQGWQDSLSKGPMVWCRDAVADKWYDVVPTAADSLALNTWARVTLVADNGTGTLYVNGVAVATGSVPTCVTSDTQLFLGVNAWDTPFNGAIDELYIYNRALSAEDVAALPIDGSMIQDVATGVTIIDKDGSLPDLDTIDVTTLTEDDADYAEVVDALSDRLSAQGNSINDMVLFDITLLDAEGNEINLEEGQSVAVRMNLPEDFDASKVLVYHIADDGTITLVANASNIINGVITFNATGFSKYAIVEGDVAAATEPESTTVADSTTATTTAAAATTTAAAATTTVATTAAQTGDTASVMPFVILLMVAGAAILIVANKKKVTE